MKYLALLFALFSSVAYSADWYVRAGATGTGTGLDWTNAFTSLPATLNRGDTYFIAGGSYASYIFDDVNSGATNITIKKATAAVHGTNTGWNTAYATGQADFVSWDIYTDFYTFDGQTRNSNWRSGAVSEYGIKVGNIRMDDANGNAADNITFKYVDAHGGGRDTGAGDDVIYTLFSSKNIIFQYCSLRDSDRTIFLTRGTPENWLVEYNYIARNASSAAIHGEIMSSTDSLNMVWRYNVIEDPEGTAVWAFINDGVATNWEIYGNTITHTSSYNREGISGAVFCANDASNQNFCNNFKVYNNSIVNVIGSYSGFVFQAGSGNLVKNNLWYNSVQTNGGNNVTLDYNWYFNTIDNDNSVTKTVCASNCNLFTDLANRDFHLTAHTVAGTVLVSPYNTDPDGVARSATNWDRGAYQLASTPPVPFTPPANLVARYKFNSDLTDVFGNHGAANLLKIPSFASTSGSIGSGSMLCDGNDEVTVPYLPFYDFNDGTKSQFTISVWVKPTTNLIATPGAESIVVGRYTDMAGTLSLWQVNAFGGNANQGIYARQQNDSITSPAFAAGANAVPPINEWTHIAYTYDSVTGFQRLYFNGITGMPVFSSNNRPVGIKVKPGKGTFSICGVPTYGAVNAHFSGYVDELQIYNRALTQAEITTLYNQVSE